VVTPSSRSILGALPRSTAKLATFEEGVIDRLFALNAKRAEEERFAGLGAAREKKKRGGRKMAARRVRKEATATKQDEPQVSLAPEEE
jgi:hypothetical protein